MSEAALIAIVGLVGTIFGVIGGVVGSAFSYKTQKPITQAQSERSALQDSNELRAQMKQEREEYRKEYLELREKFEAMEKEFENVRGELDDLRLGVGILTAQLVKHGHTPEWKPRTFTDDPLDTQPVKHGFKR